MASSWKKSNIAVGPQKDIDSGFLDTSNSDLTY
jgi:hypothetical protein